MLQLNGDSDTERDMFTSFLDHDSLDAAYLQELYIDSRSSHVRSRSLSPMSVDSSISHTLSSGFVSSTPIPNTNASSRNMSQLGFQPTNHVNFVANSKDIGMYPTPLAVRNTSLHSRHHQKNMYVENKIQQQHIEAQQQQNEISNSLKMFAMLAAYKNGNDYIRQKDPPVDDIMQDFYCNGYVTDDSNSFEPEDPIMEAALHKPYSPNYNDHNQSSNYIGMNFNKNYGFSSQNHINPVNNDSANIAALNYQYLNQNLWMFHLPTHAPYMGNGMISSAHYQHAANVAAAAAATAAAAANIDYNNQSKKPQKRFGSTKYDKYSAVKHCVFCENNNEPEAVVKSHAVRDSLGRVLCPKLRTYICPICKASGDKAHTVKYCPQKPIITMEDAVKAESLRLAKNSYFKQGMKA